MKIPLDKFENYLRNKNLKERSIEDYIYYFNKFTYDAFNQETISRFLADKTNRNSIARAFLNNYKKFLTVNYKELGLSKDIREEIIEIELPKITGRDRERVITPLSREEIHLLEKHLATEELKIKLLISFYCGLRLGELMKIKVNSFNWEKWKTTPDDYGECIVLGKGDKEGIAFVPGTLMKRIAIFIKAAKHNNPDSYLFDTRSKAKLENKARYWADRLYKAGLDSGITKRDTKGEVIDSTVVHPHRLRHSYALYLRREKNLDAFDIKELMRHKSIESTQVYVHMDKDYLKEKLKPKG